MAHVAHGNPNHAMNGINTPSNKAGNASQAVQSAVFQQAKSKPRDNSNIERYNIGEKGRDDDFNQHYS